MINATHEPVEETITLTIDLPEGQDYAWFADANVIGLARRLSPAEREHALAQALGRYGQG